MFFSSNTTHFTLYVDGSTESQNNNNPTDTLISKTKSAMSSGMAGSNASSNSFANVVAGVGDKLSSLKGGVTKSGSFY